MVWSNAFVNELETHVPLAPMTWYRLGGPAQWFITPNDIDDLIRARRYADDMGLAFRLLGRGANILVPDVGVDGVVVRMQCPAFDGIDIQGTTVVAGSGVDLMRLCRTCCDYGLSGLEMLTGIPATVGGAIAMNAGGIHGEISDVVHSVSVLSPDGTIRNRDAADLHFGYRHAQLDGDVVLSVEMALRRDEPEIIKRRYDNLWIQKRESQPYGDRSAGCVFKNPPGHSAGMLIDRAGLKGMMRGGACVSSHHANFIVTDNSATSSDVLRVVDCVRETVDREFGIELELEMVVW